MSLPPNHRDSQPGLELAPSSDPEVLYRPSDPYPIAVPGQAPVPYPNEGSLYTADGSYGSPPSSYGYTNGEKVLPPYPSALESGVGAEAGAAAGPGSRKKLWIMIGVLAAVAVIIGAVVGGVVGSKSSANGAKAAESSGSTSSPNSSNGNGNSTGASVNTTSVRPLTRLSVTGRRLAGDGFTSRLFWQGGDNHIRTSKYTSTGGQWSRPLVFSGLDAKPGTPIPATIYLLFPQFEVYYLDSKNTFRGINFGEDETAPKTDSIETDRAAFTIDDGTQMSAYWPYIIYQNPNSTFHRQVFDSRGMGYFNDTMQGWFDTDVVPLGDNRTGIAVVPTVKAYKGPYAAGIAYRDQDGRLSVFSFGGDDTGISWDTGSPNIPIPARTSIAAIAVGRPNSNSTNTWILYQDANNKIQCVYQDDANGWKGPQEVGDADAGTDIACLTETVLDEPEQVLLSEQTDMRRCYYQYNGAIQEKRLTSSTWIDGDTIPTQ
ncbi:uncharacterized protein GGS22DRAFT_187771 [Annulohypoxylon maeteangense]|uniref:uncharacterized protein n=1 Tax=Annulohypoxylon maeteangense TaxID=1927788 RepID=UPI002008E997|nr:uncharacterized protein GGS22DRAFT_187771 [Annulohypoxylon maeteangense]KAI0885487.1 hypothetical protein GGS22DRAFT_187771 [Annulohypoxylon maeteangense]